MDHPWNIPLFVCVVFVSAETTMKMVLPADLQQFFFYVNMIDDIDNCFLYTNVSE